jgi:hypothetical protein
LLKSQGIFKDKEEELKRAKKSKAKQDNKEDN